MDKVDKRDLTIRLNRPLKIKAVYRGLHLNLLAAQRVSSSSVHRTTSTSAAVGVEIADSERPA